MFHSRVFIIVLASTLVLTLADPIDWVNIDYLTRQLQNPPNGGSSTKYAQRTIVQDADSISRQGPWSINSGNHILPPSKDKHDYLSWAPYHWPECNWCGSSGRNHLAHGNDSTSDPNDTPDDDSSPQDGQDDYSDQNTSDQPDALWLGLNTARRSHRLMKIRRQTSRSHRDIRDAKYAATDEPPTFPHGQMPIGVPVMTPTPTLGLTSNPTVHSQSTRSPTGTPGPAFAPAKGCTPSPTKSLAPSATWTTCPYVVRDGRVNPDVRQLVGPPVVQTVSQAILSNAVAYVLTGSTSYIQNTVDFLETFFLDQATAINPNVNYGQIVRGPGARGQKGTFTGPLDLRGIVKVANAVKLLKALKAPEWTLSLDQAMQNWVAQYTDWLRNSDIGQCTAGKPNNHVSFYVSQLAALQIVAGNYQAANKTLSNFFKGPFLEQIASNGEQPWEAVRTRPYHYRCFNLEALITNAKLGDQVGANFWSAKSKYKTTIQDALDHLMELDPGKEDGTEIVPHVAAVAAAYGDPSGKYAKFMKKVQEDYNQRPFWYFDQAAAFPNSPAGRATKSRRFAHTTAEKDPVRSGNVPVTKFECPSPFREVEKIEIDNDIFVTCPDIKCMFVSCGNDVART